MTVAFWRRGVSFSDVALKKKKINDQVFKIQRLHGCSVDQLCHAAAAKMHQHLRIEWWSYEEFHIKAEKIKTP